MLDLQCRNLTTFNAADTIFRELSSFSGTLLRIEHERERWEDAALAVVR
jgi:hypothetical protein